MIDTGAIRFVYFDLDDTILDHARAEKLALQDLHYQPHSVLIWELVLPFTNTTSLRVLITGTIRTAPLQPLT